MALAPDLADVLNDLRPAAHRAIRMRRVQRRRRTVALAATLAVLIVGSAFAAIRTLGEPAPEPIATNLHRSAVVLFGNHRQLVAGSATVLAESPDATLYGLSDTSGAYCVELIGARRGLVFSFGCDEGVRVGNQFLSPGNAGTDSYFLTVDGKEPPVVRWGRLASGTTAARAVYPNGTSEDIEIGLDGFFVYEPTDQLLARRFPMTIQFLDDKKQPRLSTEVLPPQPLETTGTVGRPLPNGARTEHPLEISGHVLIANAAKIEVQSFTGRARAKSTFIGLDPDGNFRFKQVSAEPVALYVDDAQGKRLTDWIFPMSQAGWERIVGQARTP